MKRTLRFGAGLAIAAFLTTAAMTQTARASFTLGDLVRDGGSLTIGDKTFSNFGWQTSDETLSSQAANLTVTASILNGVYYLDFGGLIALYNNAGASESPLLGDIKLSYTVTANPGLINMIDQNYTPNATPSSGQIVVGETVKNNLGVIVGNSTLTLNPTDLSDPQPEDGDNLNFAGESQLTVVKDISIVADAGQLVGFSDIEQSFHQVAVPEPTTIIAGALLLLPFGASTLRILRRNRIA